MFHIEQKRGNAADISTAVRLIPICKLDMSSAFIKADDSFLKSSRCLIFCFIRNNPSSSNNETESRNNPKQTHQKPRSTQDGKDFFHTYVNTNESLHTCTLQSCFQSRNELSGSLCEAQQHPSSLC